MFRTASSYFVTMAMGLALVMLNGCTAKINPEYGSAVPRQAGSAQPAKPLLKPDKAPEKLELLEAEPVWFSCQADSDCRVEKGLCDGPQAINTAFLAPFERYRRQMGQQIDCAVSQKKPEQFTAKCLKNRCSLQPLKP